MKYDKMKRGRPNVRYTIHSAIIETLSRTKTPVTISMVLKEISKTSDHKLSWNTIQKYMQELVESGKIQAIQLQHSKLENKPGLVVYTLKR